MRGHIHSHKDQGLKPIILSLSLIKICNHHNSKKWEKISIANLGGMLHRKVFGLVLETFPRWITITELKTPKPSTEIEFRPFVFSFTNIL